MKKRIQRTPWRWNASELARDDDDGELWLCPDLPPAGERSSHPLAVHISYCCAELPCAGPSELNDGLFALWRAFSHDSVLAAIRRQSLVSHLLVYTAAPQGIADRRCYDIREALRPPSLAVRFVEEPGWDALEQLLLLLSPKGASAQGATR